VASRGGQVWCRPRQHACDDSDAIRAWGLAFWLLRAGGGCGGAEIANGLCNSRSEGVCGVSRREACMRRLRMPLYALRAKPHLLVGGNVPAMPAGCTTSCHTPSFVVHLGAAMRRSTGGGISTPPLRRNGSARG